MSRAVPGWAVVCGAMLVSAGSIRAQTLRPDRIVLTLGPGESHDESKVLDIPPLGSLPVDVVWMIDSTGSMADAIDALKVELDRIIARLSLGYTDIRMGLADHRDHPSTRDSNPYCPYSNLYGASTDSCLYGLTPLTPDLTAGGPLVQAINAVVAADGGDFPECHGAIFQMLADDPANGIGWRPGSYRLVVALTDTGAHDCDFCAIRPGGCPSDILQPPGMNGVEPGLDGRIDTGAWPDDAPILDAVDALRQTGLHAPIELAVIFSRYLDLTGNPQVADEIGTPYDPADPPGVWRLLAQRAGGDARAVSERGLPPGGVSLEDFVKGLIDDVTATCREVTVDVSDPAYRSWVTALGMPLPAVIARDVVPATSLPFGINLGPPAGTPPGPYTFGLRAFCDGVYLAAQSIEIAVRDCQPGAPDVTPNSLRAARRVPVGGRFVWASTGAGAWNLHADSDRARIPGLWMDPGSQVATVTVTDATDPGAWPRGYYQVYGADNCTGASVP